MKRRHFLLAAGSAATFATLGIPRRASAEPRAAVGETKIISRRPDLYHGWPTVCRCRSGKLLVAYSGGREAHICPFGRVELIESADDGATWSDARVLAGSVIDHRDAGVLETARGTLLVTTFTSLAYESLLAKAEKIKPGEKSAWPAARLERWKKFQSEATAAERKAKLGVWMLRSTDAGRNWSPLYDCLVSSPHGPTQLSDGRLVYAGKDLWRPSARVGVSESTDDGRTWHWLADLPVRPGDSAADFHELHAVEARSGRLVMHIRNHNKADDNETLQSESTDGGRTWSAPHAIGVWGLPSHLLRLRDGRLLMSYGHRRAPLGNQCRLSADEGRTWSAPLVVSGDGVTGDLGYPSTVELADGTLLTVWYESMRNSPHAVLRQARWKLEG